MSLALELRAVKKSYQQGENKIEILRELDLKIEEAATVAILGQSGSGKSTLLTLLAGLDQPDSGQIILQGTILGQLSNSEMTNLRGKKIGFVFQQYHLLSHLTALENVMLPLEIAGIDLSLAENKAEQLLKNVGLASRLQHLPKQLSGGECQRVAIARALVTSPALILADEPSGSLDVETGKQVMDVLFSQVKAQGLTLLVVTHSQEVANRCGLRYELRNGKLQAQ